MRHYIIDVMHTEKNVFYSIIFTTFSDTKKTKNHNKTRADRKLMNFFPELWIPEGRKKKPKVPFTLTQKQYKLMCDWFHLLALLNGYASNIGNYWQSERLCIKYKLFSQRKL